MAAWPQQPVPSLAAQQQQQQLQLMMQQQQLMQQHAAAQAPSIVVPSQAPGAAPVPGTAPCISVVGCQNPTVANIIKGTYQHQTGPEGMNHGKPVYKKDGVAATVSVLIYYWDERDGPTFSGWWFGPKVGGDQVWAYNVSRNSPLPPTSGWKVPWDGPVDESLRLLMGPSTGPKVIPAQPWAAQPPGGMVDQRRQRQLVEMAQKEAERKKREEDMRRRQQEREEEMQRRQTELRRKREEEEAKRTEQAAALIVRKVIQRVRIATPDNFDELRQELERTQSEQLEKMGSQAEKVLQEAEKAMLQAQERVDQISEKRLADEKKKAEEEQRKREEVERVERLAKEAAEDVAAAEQRLAEASDAAKPTVDAAEDTSPDAMLEAASTTEKAVDETRAKLDATSKALVDKRAEMGSSELALSKLRTELRPLFSKLAICRRSLEKLKDAVNTTKDKAGRKAAALKKQKEQKDLFDKYDADADGKLKREEVAAFAKAEYEFAPGDEHLDKIIKALATDDGVPFDKFQRLRSMVAIAKSEVRAREKRAEEEEKERLRKIEEEKRRAEVEERRLELRKALEALAKPLGEAAEAAAKVDDIAKPLAIKTPPNELSADRLKEVAAESEAATKPVKEMLDKALADVAAFEAEADDFPELKPFRKEEAGKLRSQAAQSQGVLDRALAAARAARERSARKQYAELEALRSQMVAAMRDLMSAESKSPEQLFEQINAGTEGSITREKLLAFAKGLSGFTLEEGMGERFFAHLTEDSDSITLERLTELIRVFYKVIKPTVLTETMSIKSKTNRRLESNELVEVLEGPKQEDNVSVMRVRCRAVQDGLLGWVTVAGNQGTVFLEPGGNVMTCIKDTIITDGLSVSNSKTIRKVAKGELIEVLEFQKKDASCDVMRIKGKAKSDGTIGWVTIAGNQGTTFLELS